MALIHKVWKENIFQTPEGVKISHFLIITFFSTLD